ncbi:nucleoside/nucleotide kinase family protein [Microlunatus soli]|uniref:hypothetical protein n=1 Tax=Microlunatus soli TaxID=630515 RepID=UPI0012F7A9D1|nr:hypothetical protein [Microlunatus soli]
MMGPSGAGKSTLAKRLEESRPDLFARVPVDFFFVPRGDEVSVAEYLSAAFGYDWDAVDRVLTCSGEERSTPDCDFESFRWRAPYGGLPVAEAPVLVLDGMRPHPRCDLLIMLELDSVTQTERLTARDRRWGTAVADRRAHLAATFSQGCRELPREPDLRLDAAATVEDNLGAIVGLVSRARR